MNSQEDVFSSAQHEANRQVLTLIAIVSFTSCLLILALGLLVWLFAPHIYRLIAAQVAGLSSGTALYVRPDGAGLACDSWENACDLQTALQAAAAGDEIWVEAGLYRPAADTHFPEATFQLKDGVALYGGFAGTETARDQRDWETWVTVLSGDLGGDDTTDPHGVVTDTANIVGPNAYHVVTGSGVNTTAVLDGFVITAGYANLTPPNNHGYGGGMFNWTGSPTLNNLIFSGNTAGEGAAYYGGGGMFNIYSSNPVLTNVTFSGNSAGEYGGGLCNTFSSGPTLTNVTITGNQAPHGSGVCNVGGSLTLVNGIIWGNTPTQGQVYNDHVTPDITYSDIEGGFPGVGNLNVDPRFGVFEDYGSLTRVFTLLSSSPVIDQGSPSVCPATDQLGLSRPVDGDGNDSAICDMGAFEYSTPDSVSRPK